MRCEKDNIIETVKIPKIIKMGSVPYKKSSRLFLNLKVQHVLYFVHFVTNRIRPLRCEVDRCLVDIFIKNSIHDSLDLHGVCFLLVSLLFISDIKLSMSLLKLDLFCLM